MKIEVVFAFKDEQYIVPVEVPEDSTLEIAIVQSGIKEKIPEFFKQFPDYKTGIFGKLYDKSAVLSEGDRVEIYRPLIVDTMARRFDLVKKTRRPAKKHKWK